jgi:hypothetical protein
MNLKRVLAKNRVRTCLLKAAKAVRSDGLPIRTSALMVAKLIHGRAHAKGGYWTIAAVHQ